MNIKRFFSWSAFVVVIVLIVWGMIAASQKAAKQEASLPIPNEISSNDWVKGNKDSSVIFVEYSDFQCPACAAYFPLIERVVNEASTTIKFVYRHFPLTQHANAVPAAQAAEAAGRQGKFWEMYEKIFTTQTEWQDSKTVDKIFYDYASKMGLDMIKFDTDFKSKEVADKINNDLKSGVKAGINSTPTFYLNGNKISNPQSYEEFKKLIDDTIYPKIKS
jgi:protein-disulfide isomerase